MREKYWIRKKKYIIYFYAYLKLLKTNDLHVMQNIYACNYKFSRLKWVNNFLKKSFFLLLTFTKICQVYAF